MQIWNTRCHRDSVATGDKPIVAWRRDYGSVDLIHYLSARFLAGLGASLAIASAATLGGCSDTSLSSMLSGPEVAKPASSQLGQNNTVLVVSLAPINGPPAAFTEALIRELNHAAWERKIALLVDPTAKGDYVLRGNFTASNSKNKASLAYNWDILDKSGNRVTRAADEVTSDGATASASPWTNISPAAIKSVAEKAAAALATQIKPNT